MTRYIQHLLTVALVAIAVALPAAMSQADSLVLQDGRKFEGKVVSEDGSTVVFVISSHGATLRTRFPRSQIKTITRETKEGPAYCKLPILGSIGDFGDDQFVTAKSFRAALREARKVKPDYVVLVIDSGGGDVAEMEEIIAAIVEADDLHFVAYVEKALSAGAVIAMACPEIVMAPGGIIGAAVPYKVGPDGTPKNIEEKFQSAIRASFRRAANTGGHPSLLVRGMMETDLELTIVHRDGKPLVVDARSGSRGTPLKRRGEILTLTADEAVACGLARGIADSVYDIKTHFILAEWHETGQRAWHRITNAARAKRVRDLDAQRRQLAEIERAQRAAFRIAHIARLLPEIGRIEVKLVELAARRHAAEDVEHEAESQMQRELWAIADDRNSAMNRARFESDPGYWRQRALEIYDIQAANIRRRYHDKTLELRRIAKEAEYEEHQLIDRHEQLIASIPPEE